MKHTSPITDWGGAEPYSDTNAPTSFEMTQAAAPAAPTAGQAVVYTPDGKNIYIQAPDGQKSALFNTEAYTFSISGNVAVGAGVSRIYMEGNYLVETVRASVNTAPTGATILVDVNKNGTTIYTTQSARPTIATSGFTALGGTPAVTAFASGDYMTVDVDQVGSTIPGANLTVNIRMRRLE